MDELDRLREENRSLYNDRAMLQAMVMLLDDVMPNSQDSDPVRLQKLILHYQEACRITDQYGQIIVGLLRSDPVAILKAKQFVEHWERVWSDVK